MTNPTDANGRQRTSTDAPRPLRETVARAIHECGPEGNKDGDDWEFGYIDRYVTAVYEQADAAIAAMVDALLSETAVEAARRSYDDAFVEHLMSTAPGLFAAKAALSGALEAVGAVEGETK